MFVSHLSHSHIFIYHILWFVLYNLNISVGPSFSGHGGETKRTIDSDLGLLCSPKPLLLFNDPLHPSEQGDGNTTLGSAPFLTHTGTTAGSPSLALQGSPSPPSSKALKSSASVGFVQHAEDRDERAYDTTEGFNELYEEPTSVETVYRICYVWAY